MKTALIAATALLLAPVSVLAQSAGAQSTGAQSTGTQSTGTQSAPEPTTGAAAGSVPNSFDGPAPAQARSARPAPAAPVAQASDIARSEEALRSVIAAAQGSGFDYSVFTPNLATQIRQQSPQVTPLLKSFGAVDAVDYLRQEGEAQLFRVTFDNRVTEWVIGFDGEDRIAALLFRPADE